MLSAERGGSRAPILVQVAFNAFVTGTLFFRTRLHRNTVDDADLYLAALFFTLTAMLFNNWAEFAIVSERLSLFYKQVLPAARSTHS